MRIRTCLLLALTACAGIGGMEIKSVPKVETDFIPLKSLSYEEASQVAKTVLSKQGRVGFLKTRNLLVVHDVPEKIRELREVLAKVDTDPANIRIEVRFLEEGRVRGGGMGVEVDGVRIGRTDGRTRVEGRVRGRAGFGTSTFRDSTTQSILAGNGREARIWIGTEVADPVWVREYGRGHGWWTGEFIQRELGASLWVRPRILPDGNIEVAVYPRISVRGKEPFSVDARELGTRVVVADGQMVSIGGLDRERRQAYVKLFGIGRLFNGSSLNVTLTPSIVAPRRGLERSGGRPGGARGSGIHPGP